MKKGKIKYDEFVQMTEVEYGKLVDKYGLSGAKKCIEKLNNYKGSTGKSYKSDYLTVLNWVASSEGVLALKVDESYGLSDTPENETELQVLKERGVKGLREYRKGK